ncbi:regulator of chromosome condensation 1/beta-lactamase-inhibitor protein II [Lipomyces chichibuensis]|uniref:regulator of chromosome condensation 1/beta-lactamase-inhibitor protein II n=1 Tax=Lipomyces chichibuensis TaxID=1546026 RepID=UPI0033439711
MPKTWVYAIGLDIFAQLSGASKQAHKVLNSRDCTGESAETDGRKKRKIIHNENENEYENANEMDADEVLIQPRCIAQGEFVVEVLWVGWSETLLRIDGRVELRGFSAHDTETTKILQLSIGATVVTGFGWADLLGVVDSNGQIWRFTPGAGTTCILYVDKDLSSAFDNTVQRVAVTGTEHVAVLHDYGTAITTFSSLPDFYAYSETKEKECRAASRKQLGNHQHLQFTCMRAGEAHFVALDSGGQVYTWGANLHGELLQPRGSIVRPRIVPALEGIPMRDVATNGFVTACLSQDTKDVYIWGWTPDTRIIGLPDAGDDVAGIIDQFGENEDIVIESVAVGNGFIVLASSNSITCELCVWFAGGSDLTNMFGLPRSEKLVKVNGEWSGKRRDEYGVMVSCGTGCIFVSVYQK